MTRVVIFESNPGVLSGLERRLEDEPFLRVIGAYGDLRSFETAIRTLQPDIAVVSALGAGAIPAASLAQCASGTVRLLVLVTGTRTNERLGYPRTVEFVSDGPRGDLLVKRLLHLGTALRKRSAGHPTK